MLAFIAALLLLNDFVPMTRADEVQPNFTGELTYRSHLEDINNWIESTASKQQKNRIREILFGVGDEEQIEQIRDWLVEHRLAKQSFSNLDEHPEFKREIKKAARNKSEQIFAHYLEIFLAAGRDNIKIHAVLEPMV